MSDDRDQRAVAFLQGAFFPPIPNFRQQLLDLGETARLEPPRKVTVSPPSRPCEGQSARRD